MLLKETNRVYLKHILFFPDSIRVPPQHVYHFSSASHLVPIPLLRAIGLDRQLLVGKIFVFVKNIQKIQVLCKSRYSFDDHSRLDHSARTHFHANWDFDEVFFLN